MLPTVTATGVEDAYMFLGDVSRRMVESEPAFDRIADELFSKQRRWWLTGGDGTWGRETDKQPRAGRDPRYMIETGFLRRAMTQRRAQGKQVKVRGQYLFFKVIDNIALIQSNRGREPFVQPADLDEAAYADILGRFYLTGRA